MNQNEKWYFARNKDTIGPVTLADMRAMMQRGEIKATDLVYHELLGQWTPAGKVALLQDALTAAPPIAGPPLTIKTSQPRNNAPNKNVAPPAGHMVMRTANAEPAPEAAAAPADNVNRYEAPKSDSGKAEPAAGAGTLFDVSGSISDPDDELDNASAMSGADTLIEKGAFLDFIPNMLRSGFPGKVATAMGKFFASIGVLAQLIGVVLIVVLAFAICNFNIALSLKALCVFGTPIIILLATAYVNKRLMPSLTRLNNLGEGRIVSTALPDSLCVVFLGLAIWGLVSNFFTGLNNENSSVLIGYAIYGFVLFAAFAFCSVTAANPGSLNMTVDGSLPPASEAAGAIQYLSKLFLRLSLGLYGFIMSLYALKLVGTIIQSFSINEDTTVIEGLGFAAKALDEVVTLTRVSFLPLAAYLTFLGVQFFLDFAIKVVQNRR
ncbi:MAG: DUF4339 domain-containing protein [Thermoguttaceae bacterium]|nr:DUF4339 domain-containing protein [Thermoguttaceae bacterium]